VASFKEKSREPKYSVTTFLFGVIWISIEVDFPERRKYEFSEVIILLYYTCCDNISMYENSNQFRLELCPRIR